MKKNFEQNTEEEEEDEEKEPKYFALSLSSSSSSSSQVTFYIKHTPASSPEGRMELLSHKLELLPITKTQTLTHITHTNYRYDTIVANYSIFPPFLRFVTWFC